MTPERKRAGCGTCGGTGVVPIYGSDGETPGADFCPDCKPTEMDRQVAAEVALANDPDMQTHVEQPAPNADGVDVIPQDTAPVDTWDREQLATSRLVWRCATYRELHRAEKAEAECERLRGLVEEAYKTMPRECHCLIYLSGQVCAFCQTYNTLQRARAEEEGTDD